MKLPRWLVVSLLTLSVFALSSAGAWWWVTWPVRTAREFVTLVENLEWELANDMVTPDAQKNAHWIEYERVDTEDLWSIGLLFPNQRSLTDILCARQTFGIGDHVNMFVVIRNKVVDGLFFWAPTGHAQPEVRN